MKRDALIVMTAKTPSSNREMPIVTMEIAVESFVRVKPEKLSFTV
jgi:hypothetical protein